jgi:hypothetical protein
LLQVQGKVLKKLAKKHGDGLDEAHIAGLLQQLLENSRYTHGLQEPSTQQAVTAYHYSGSNTVQCIHTASSIVMHWLAGQLLQILHDS